MSNNTQNIKIALIHDWLLGVGGAEKTLKTFHDIFPQAPIYTLFYNKKFTDWFLPQAEIRTTFTQNFYRIFQSHKLLTPLLPIAIETIDLSDFDLVISSSVAFAKGLVLKPRTKHICYCYSPTRQLWDWHAEYKKEISFTPKLWASLVQHFLRIWDRHASTRVDHFVAISENVRQRIKKYYQRDSSVIYPPVTKLPVANYQLPITKGYFLIVSRLFKHKNIDIAIGAFNKLGWPLIIIGNGPENKNLKSQISNLKNIKMLGFVSDKELPHYYQNCIAFIMPQEEDFGITPIEAMSYGKPVLALKRGGALEYIQEGINGEFFDDPTEEVLADGIRRLKQNLPNYDSEKIKKTAERFSEKRFKNEITDLVKKVSI
ncbi:MAG: glycosyltransferase [Candidatus Yanofskybacteria bacterium]|nr:glycosyltransferase [Candidatus Yanofskybacteria bacterium]